MNLLAYGLVALAILGALGGIGYKVRQSGYDACRAETLAEAEQLRRDEAEKGMQAGIKLETGNAKAKVVFRTITRDVDKIVDRPVYRNVCFDDDGLRNANAALLGKSAPSGESDGRVPVLGAASGRDGSDGAAKDSRDSGDVLRMR